MAAPSNPYPSLSRAVDPALVRDIRQASKASSTDFGLLMAQASRESSFKPDAKAATGSATGLFQFVDSTWLDMVHRFGAKYGASDLAQQITTDSAGRPQVSDPAARQHILALRNDPALSASLAGEYANLNKGEVERALGHAARPADLYMAHFLGAGGATVFLKALETKGATPAADLLPDAAASNHAIFYDGETGRARSVAEIYRTLGGHVEADAQAYSATLGDAGTAPGASHNNIVAAVADATAPAPTRLNFAGLTITQPMAALLDTLTLAALKLVASAKSPLPPTTHQDPTTRA